MQGFNAPFDVHFWKKGFKEPDVYSEIILLWRVEGRSDDIFVS